MQVELIYQVVIPLLQRKGVALIGISTLDCGADNFWVKMIHRKYDDGTPMFNTFVWESSCKACQTAGKADTCMHERSRQPFWLSSVNGNVLRALYGDDNATYIRETRNIDSDQGGSRFFEASLIDWMSVPQNIFQSLPTGSADHFFVTIDPAAGGLKSQSVCHVWCTPSPGQLLVSFYSKKALTALMNSASVWAERVVLHHTNVAAANASIFACERTTSGWMSPPRRTFIRRLKWSQMPRMFPCERRAKMRQAIVWDGNRSAFDFMRSNA